jgi:hypothetical protein
MKPFNINLGLNLKEELTSGIHLQELVFIMLYEFMDTIQV